MKRRKRGLEIFKITCIMLLVSITVLLAGCKKKMNFQEYLDLGDKYLLELNYEEAAVAFAKAIELEPREMGAYEKLANVYAAQGNTKQAMETLNQAISVYEGLSAEDQTEERKAAYERIRAAANDLSIKNTLETEYMDLLKQLKEQMLGDSENFGTGDFGSSEILGRNFYDLTESLTKPLIWQLEDGTWLAVYPGGYVYAGEMEDGKRSGNGAWYSENSDYGYDVLLFKGKWKDDYPNGKGTEKMYLGYDGGLIQTKEGTYIDGLEDGTRRISITDPLGLDVYQYSATKGIPDNVVIDPNSDEPVVEMEHISGPDINVWNVEESDWGVDGAMK